jgi:ATP-binding cassette subfamily A (ABC1) protein 3
VLAKHILDIGTTGHLRQKYGFGFHVHVVLKSAPNSTLEEMNAVKTWIEERFPGAETERDAWLGQLRFNIPSSPPAISSSSDPESPPAKVGREEEHPSVGSLFVLLEENKQKLGLEFYSVSVSTFDEVFLKVVRRHGVEEEDRQVSGWRTKLSNWRTAVFACFPFL